MESKSRLFVLFLASFLLISGCLQSPPRACTAEARMCPDGSYVGRAGPNCEFSPCPNAAGCEAYPVDACPAGCEICPPCAECSSIGCHPPEFCRGIGFESDWHNNTLNPGCTCPEGYIWEGDACTPECYYSTPRCLMPSIPCNSTG